MNRKSYSPLLQKISVQASLFELGNSIKKHGLIIEDIGDLIPGSVMVQDLSRMTNTYMNNKGCEILMHSNEELQELGSAYFDKFFPKEEIITLSQEITRFVQQGDCTRDYSFFQRVRPNAQTDYKWYLTTTKLYPQADITSSCNKVIHIAIEANNSAMATKKLSYLYEQNELVQKNYVKYLQLTSREKEIIKLIVDGNSSCTIAEMLFISINTVNNHRKNILGKLQAKSLSELIKFAVAFNIL